MKVDNTQLAYASLFFAATGLLILLSGVAVRNIRVVKAGAALLVIGSIFQIALIAKPIYFFIKEKIDHKLRGSPVLHPEVQDTANKIENTRKSAILLYTISGDYALIPG